MQPDEVQNLKAKIEELESQLEHLLQIIDEERTVRQKHERLLAIYKFVMRP